MKVRQNEDAKRFEAEVDGGTAVLDYRMDDELMVLTHTKVPGAAEGEGVGSALVRYALEHARSAGFTVDPQCPFVSAYIREHGEYADLVAG